VGFGPRLDSTLWTYHACPDAEPSMLEFLPAARQHAIMESLGWLHLRPLPHQHALQWLCPVPRHHAHALSRNLPSWKLFSPFPQRRKRTFKTPAAPRTGRPMAGWTIARVPSVKGSIVSCSWLLGPTNWPTKVINLDKAGSEPTSRRSPLTEPTTLVVGHKSRLYMDPSSQQARGITPVQYIAVHTSCATTFASGSSR
jgi:hypothetical protein